jgi:hypothetical protein
MSTNKRISGNYTIQTLNAGDQITVTTSNVAVNGNLQVSGNIVGNNALSVGTASVAGNVTANFFVGNGSALTGVVASANIGVATELTNGTTTFNIPISGGNVFGNINGVSNVFIFSDSGVNVAGYVSSNTVSALANITGGNILTSGLVSATGNVRGGNIQTGGLVSAAGNVTGNYILGNGALLTGVITSVANINNGTSNVTVTSSGGNVTVGIGGTGNVAVFATTGVFVTGVVSATGNVAANFFIGNGSLLTGVVATDIGTLSSLSVSGNINTGNLRTAGLVSVAGNVIGANFVGSGAGTPTITSATNLDLSANTAVRVTGGTFRLPSFTTAQLANISGVPGDIVYNTTVNKVQSWQYDATSSFAWVSLAVSTYQ